MIMKFDYEFEFDVDDFVAYIEEEYFADDNDAYDEEDNKKWLENKLYDYVEYHDFPYSTIIYYDLKRCGGKNIYCPKIIDRTYEILENTKKQKEVEEKGEELKAHLRAIKEHCKGIKDLKCTEECPIKDWCEKLPDIFTPEEWEDID